MSTDPARRQPASTMTGDPPGLVDAATQMIHAAAAEARRAGAPESANPYDPTAMAHRVWREGWARAGEAGPDDNR